MTKSHFPVQNHMEENSAQSSAIRLSSGRFIQKFDYKASHINYVTLSICKNSVT
jgi:hypothetical protein